GLLTLIGAYLLIPSRQEEFNVMSLSEEQKRSVFAELFEIVRHKEIWTYSVTALGIYLCISVIADLWGVAFLMQALGTTKVAAAQMVSLIYVGLCAGSLSLTFLGDLLGLRQALIRLCVTLLFVCSACLLYYPHLSAISFSALFLFIGFLAGAEMLCFANLSDLVGKKASGTATGFMNCVVMLGGALVAQQVGNLLDFFWKGEFQSSGIRLYSLGDYRHSLSLVVGIIFISSLTSIFLPRQKT
ncbi:MAG: MFS transporter, partial [Bdellovibrionia bacterium]